MALKRFVKMLGYTDPRGYEYALIELEALVPDFNNPRIPSQDSALESMLRLMSEDADGMYNLATDIVENSGTNPAELTNVTAMNGTFVVREGNRRLTVRKLLRNPEQLKGHVSEAEVKRWKRLSEDARAKSLPSGLVCVIGEDHDAWVDRRHLGPQGGRGLQQWDTEAKRRRDQRRSGAKDLAVHVLDALKAHAPERFSDLEPPKRTFTTFARVVESAGAREVLGLDVDDRGRILLKDGERTIGILEEILRDLRKPGPTKLTSRKIHSSEQIVDYLKDTSRRVPRSVDSRSITLGTDTRTGGASGNGSRARAKNKSAPKDVMRSMHPPKDRRLQVIFEELRKARRLNLPNAAIVLTRLLLELSVESYAVEQDLPFAGEVNLELEQVMPRFHEDLQRNQLSVPKEVREALKWAQRQPMSLSHKLNAVLQHLANRGLMKPKEASALGRQMKAADILPLLNDAVHRLHVSPTIPRVDHILEAIAPIYNGIHKP